MSARHVSRSLIEALPLSQPSKYVCRQCRHTLQSAQVVSQQRGYARTRGPSSTPAPTEEVPYAEKVRRKLWKGKPPGPENVDDLYGKGFIDTMREERQKKNLANQKRELADVDRDLREAEADLAAERKKKGVVEVEEEEEVNASWVPLGTEAVANDSEYKGARTWDGLEAVGYKGDWRELRPSDKDEYKPWADTSSPPARSYEELVLLFQRAVNTANGLPNKAVAAGQTDIDTKLDMSTNQSRTKVLKILNHFSRLISYRIPDPLITALAAPGPHGLNVSGFLRAIEENLAPKPANVAERLMGDEVLAAQSNLLVLGRRETPVDKEKELGRWKVIESELRARGLPVLGKAEVQR
ncbi:hypothetical protein OHC33_001355 [Knufia fluminis]|uniref:Uncharacterized protein n=1 Tax=Knufia fluminis TaxID=191047 RepID=A0AAN8EZ61_9EURO|nr:hypothetical protein OHC33_001355 [Knufia fluminis]